MASSRNNLEPGPCPLCGRAMIDGPSIDRHHWIPRAQGGKEQAPMHRVCHKKIHSVLTEREIAVLYSTPDALRAHPEIARFIDWVQRHPPEWNDRHRSPRRTR